MICELHHFIIREVSLIWYRYDLFGKYGAIRQIRLGNGAKSEYSFQSVSLQAFN